MCISTMLVLTVDMEEAFVSLKKIGESDLFAHTSLVKCKHEIRDRLERPARRVPQPPILKVHRQAYHFNDGSAQRRSSRSLCVYLWDHGDSKEVEFLALGKELVHDLILEKGYLVLVAQDPHVGEKVELVGRKDVIRVEAEEILVQSIWLLLLSDDESYCSLKVFAIP
jgi:hypothetical protein